MSRVDAWLLDCGDAALIAVGEHEMVEFNQTPICQKVPATPEHCQNVLYWQNDFVPVLDLTLLLGGSAAEDNVPVCLLAYQQTAKAPLQQLAVRAKAPPTKIVVNDDQACALPEIIENSRLKSMVVSSFMHENKPVIILDLNRLCSTEFANL